MDYQVYRVKVLEAIRQLEHTWRFCRFLVRVVITDGPR